MIEDSVNYRNFQGKKIICSEIVFIKFCWLDCVGRSPS